MGCGCGAGAAAADTQWIIKFTDGSQSTTKYANETEARVALARTGKTGIVRSVPK